MKQDRKFSVMLYPDSTTYDCDSVIHRAMEVFHEWAWIKHDRDFKDDGSGELKKLHIHLIGRTTTTVYPTTIADRLGVESQYVECIKKWKSQVRYLIHLDDPCKTEYSGEDITANFDYKRYFDMSGAEQADMILAEIMNTRHTVTSLLSWSLNNGCYSQFMRGLHMWQKVMDEIYFKEN